MEISDDKYQSEGNKSNPFFAVMRTIQDFVRRLNGIFTLTEEEQLKAGIYLGGEGRD
jgi:hypothetical protein